jgi:hypothetical protein
LRKLVLQRTDAALQLLQLVLDPTDATPERNQFSSRVHAIAFGVERVQG